MATSSTVEIENTPDYWLIVLLRAIRHSDLPLAAQAQRKLRKLGIEIQFANMLRKQQRDEGGRT